MVTAKNIHMCFDCDILFIRITENHCLQWADILCRWSVDIVKSCKEKLSSAWKGFFTFIANVFKKHIFTNICCKKFYYVGFFMKTFFLCKNIKIFHFQKLFLCTWKSLDCGVFLITLFPQWIEKNYSIVEWKWVSGFESWVKVLKLGFEL